MSQKYTEADQRADKAFLVGAAYGRDTALEAAAVMLETLEYAEGGTLQPTSIITIRAAAEHVRALIGEKL